MLNDDVNDSIRPICWFIELVVVSTLSNLPSSEAVVDSTLSNLLSNDEVTVPTVVLFASSTSNLLSKEEVTVASVVLFASSKSNLPSREEVAESNPLNLVWNDAVVDSTLSNLLSKEDVVDSKLSNLPSNDEVVDSILVNLIVEVAWNVFDEPDVDSKLSNLLSNDAVVISTLPSLPLIVVILPSKEPVLVSKDVNLVFCAVLVVFKEPVSNSILSNLWSCEPVSVSNCVIRVSRDAVVDCKFDNLTSVDDVYEFKEFKSEPLINPNAVIWAELDTVVCPLKTVLVANIVPTWSSFHFFVVEPKSCALVDSGIKDELNEPCTTISSLASSPKNNCPPSLISPLADMDDAVISPSIHKLPKFFCSCFVNYILILYKYSIP